MSEKKNIDRLFQEKFKDFEATPPEFVWENIQEALQEKKKKRVIPIWMKLSGVAAVLLIGFFIGVSYLNNINPNDNPVVIESPNTPSQQPLKITPTKTPVREGRTVSDGTNAGANPNINSAVATNNDDATNNNNNAQGINTPGTASKNTTPSGKTILTNKSGKRGTATPPAFNNKNSAVAHSGRNHTNKGSNSRGSSRQQQPGNPATGVANNAAYPSGSRNRASAGSNNRSAGNSGNGVTNNNNTDIAQGGKANTANPVKGANKSNSINNNTTAVAATTGGNNNAVQNAAGRSNATNPANANNTGTPQTGIINKDIPVNEQAVAETPVDTTTVKPENELEKLLQEKLNGDKDKDKDKNLAANTTKWKVKPQVAPVFYNSLSKGSPIDGQFASNSKSYDKDLSYGVGINYEVNKRFSIRSGVNSVNLSYATQDVQFYASLNGQTSNVAARSSSAAIVVQNQGTNASVPNALFADQLPKETFNGSMVQSTGYVEVPVEMSYALVNKKFGIDLIGGVSTLFLNNNNVSVVSTQGYTTTVGEAQNLNNIHFSTNVGVGFKYRFFKAFEANFEPMFKYQVNTFSRDAGNFKPYFIGLYSGISFSF